MLPRQSRALVIGGLGFIGINLTSRLAEHGTRVTVFNRPGERHRDAAAECERWGARVVTGDVRDVDAIAEAVQNQDVIFDLAGQSGAVRSMEDPWTDLDVNCRGTLVLIEALRKFNAGAKLVFAGSRLAYGHTGSDPVVETDPLRPACIHAVHKVAAEQYLNIYARVYGLRCAIGRLTNPYGPGQPRERSAYGVVNRLIHLALAGETLRIYGDGRQLRDYIYVDDAVDALVALADSGCDGGVFNIGSGVGTPLVDMAQAIVGLAGGRVEFVDWPRLAELVETGDFVADIDRIRRTTGWQPRVSLHDGLQRTVAFYRAQAA